MSKRIQVSIASFRIANSRLADFRLAHSRLADFRLAKSWLAIALAVAWLVGSVAPLRAATGERTFTFTLLNKTYSDLAQGIEPITQGPLTVRPSSPKNALILRDNRLRLQALEDGAQKAHLELDVMGKGWLVADVEAGSLETRFQDELILPPQTLKFDGRVKLERVAGGYRVTALEGPRSVEVVIQSKLVSSLIAWCDTLAAMPLTGIDCAAVERSLTHVSLPLPAAGATYFLADTDLTADEHQALDAALNRP